MNFLEILKLRLSEFGYNSVSAEFVFQELEMVTSGLIGFEQRVPHLHGFTDARADPSEMFLGVKDLLGDAFTNNILKHIVPSCPAIGLLRMIALCCLSLFCIRLWEKIAAVVV